MTYVRRMAPIYRDGEGVKSLEGFIDKCRGVVVGLIHARKASSPGASGVDAHPYHVVTRDLWDAWLAHNGRVDEEVLGGTAGVSNPASRPDSLVLAKFLGMGSYSDVGRRLRAVVREGAVKTALNLGVVVASSVKAYLHRLSYYLGWGSTTGSMRWWARPLRCGLHQPS